MPNNQTKAITHGAMMIALFLVLLAIAYYVPLISLVAFFITPIPLAWYSAMYDRKLSISVTVLAIVMSIFIGNIMIVPFALILGATGLIIGDCLRERKSKVYLFLATGITILIAFAIQYMAMVRFFEVDFIQEGIQLAKESYEKSLEYSASLTGRELPKEQTTAMFDMLEATIPASITLAVFAMALIMMVVVLPVLKRLRLDVPKFAAFSEMRLPKAVLWYYLIVLTINLFVQPEAGTTLHMVTLNLSVILWTLLTLQGISFIHYMIDVYQYPKMIKVLATFLAIPLYSFMVLLGILDLGFNLRGMVKAKSEK